MEEARARGNEIIDQHQKALEGVFKTHKQEAVMQADTRIKTETASARQQLNTVTSKGQLKLRRQLSRVQNELKNKLFEEVRAMTEEYMKTEAYKELLVSYIAKAARFADGNSLIIYINSSDEDKKEFLEKLPQVAELAVGDACTGSNPREITPAQMEKLLKCCFYDQITICAEIFFESRSNFCKNCINCFLS